MSHSPRAWWLVLVLLGAFPLLAPSPACAPVPREGQFVQIADENAVIVWDADAKTEHFIRRATFQTEAEDFGFLVPTPSKPTLAEASDTAFAKLAKFTEPLVITKARDANPGCALGCGRDKAALPAAGLAAPNSVRVLDEKRVGGHDAVVLEADNAAALNQWLKQHGYASRPELVEWLRPYVNSGWKITAFKIAKDEAQQPGVATAAIRMSFQTDAPFFPYREPEDQRASKATGQPGARLLRVFLLARERMEGTLGSDGKWPGRTVHASDLANLDTTALSKELRIPALALSSAWWLTEFEDRAQPRPGTDEVYFTPATEQKKVVRPTVIIYAYRQAPGMALFAVVAFGLIAPSLWRSWRRR